MARVTIDDIAKELGVSNSTVSRALRDDPRIRRTVIQRVKQAAARMGYVPNIAARSLRTGQSRMIGLIVHNIRDGGFSLETMEGVEQACAEQGYGLLLCNSNYDPEREQYYLRMLQQRRADGVLILTPTSLSADPYLSVNRVMPLVLIDIALEDGSLSTVTVDHVQGSYLSTQHLLSLGHQHIVCLTGPLNFSSCARFVKGYRQAMTEAGFPAEDHIVIVAKRTELDDGYTGMLETLKISPQPTAIITISDLMAAGALKATRDYGIAVPAEFSIIGYDDVALASLTTPALTTVSQDHHALGRSAVELLLEEINNGEALAHHQIVLSPSLVVRDSTAAPPTSSGKV